MTTLSRPKMTLAAIAGALFAVATMPAFAQSPGTPMEVPEPSPAAAQIISFIADPCVEFVYDNLCWEEMEQGIKNAAELSDSDKEAIYAAIRGYAVKYPPLAGGIATLLTKYGIPVEGPITPAM